MIRLLFVLVAALVVGLAAAWLAGTGGVLTLTIADYEIRTSAAMGAALLFAAAVLLLLLLRLMSLVLLGPAKLSAFLIHRRAGKAYHALSRGLVAAAAGDRHEAAQAARHADKLLGQSSLALLLNAQAAELAQDEEQHHAACSAMLAHPETEFLAARKLTEAAVRRGNSDQALGFAQRAHARKPDSLSAGEALFDLRIRRGECADAQALMDEAIKAKRLNPETEQRWREALGSLEGAVEIGVANGGSAPA